MAEGAASGPSGPSGAGRSRRGLSIGVIVAIATAIGVGVSVSRGSDDSSVRTGESSVASLPASTSTVPSPTVPPEVSTTAPSTTPAPAPTTTLPTPPSYPAMPEVDLAKIGTATPEECQPQLPTVTVVAPAAVVAPGSDGTVVTTIPTASPEDASERSIAMTAFGCAHLDSFSGLRLSGDAVEISFTGDLSVHQAALDRQFGAGKVRAILGDVLVATRAKVREDLMPLFDQRDRNGASPIFGLGDDSYRMGVELAADQAKLASSLAAKYGKAVDITVGLLHWSVNGPVATQPLTCQSTGGPISGNRGQVAGVNVNVAAIASVRSGAQFTGSVAIRNDTASPIELTADSGFLVAPVHAVGGSTPIAISEMAISAVGYGPMAIEPGATATFDLRGGTASCDPAYGYALAPGDYEVVIPVPIAIDGNTTIVETRAPLKIIG